MEKKNNTIITVVITLLVVAVLGLGGFIVYDKVINKGDNKTNSNTQENNNSNEGQKTVALNVEIKNNRFYVNGNQVDFYSKSKLSNIENDQYGYYKTENDYYNNCEYKYEKVGEVLYVNARQNNMLGVDEYYFVSSDGKILEIINGENSTIELSSTSALLDVEKIEGNSIYFKVEPIILKINGTDGYCQAVKNYGIDGTAIYIDKVTYLGNGKFKLDKAVDKITYGEYQDYDSICAYLN